MLEIKNARKTFQTGSVNEHVALDDFSLTLKDGEFITIIGSNGAGKTSLFNAICGTFWLDSGQIILNGQDISFMPEHKRAHLIGRVFQDPMKGTAPGMTIEENLALAYSRTIKKPLGFSPNRKERELFRERLAEFNMGLEDRMKTRVGLLSGGQRQVVTLLMCTLTPPQLLLLDEHTAALDPATANKVMDITNMIVSRYHLTTMMITHNMHAALVTGDRTIMMDEGKPIFDFQGETRARMSLEQLLHMYSDKKKQDFDNDRMLITQ